jgi:hypothetical protein
VIVTKPGKYRWTRDVGLRGPWCIETREAGSVIEVTQIDSQGHKIWGPEFPDWQHWDQPLEAVIDGVSPQ